MALSPSDAPAQPTSTSPAKPALMIAAVFVVAMSVSFVFFRNSEPAAKTRPLDPENHASAAPKKPSGEKVQLELQRERFLENVGSVSSISLYQAYLNIGLLADAVKSATYTEADAVELLNTNKTLLATVDAQLQKLENIGLAEEETVAVKQIRKISALLQSQTGHLQAYWRSGQKPSLDQFQQVRGESWNELRAILGLAAQPPAKAE